jgi:hypothetical protein
MDRRSRAPKSLGRTGLCAAMLLLAACAGAPPRAASSAVAGPVAGGAARIWFYRDYEPSVSLNVANVALNGAPAGSVQPDGSAIYRDIAPGRYHITVESVGVDVNQDRYVDLAPGQQAYVKVLAGEWVSGGGEFSSFHRDTFYISLVPPQVAQAELATRPITGG